MNDIANEELGAQPATDQNPSAPTSGAELESGSIVSKFDSLSEEETNAILFPEEVDPSFTPTDSSATAGETNKPDEGEGQQDGDDTPPTDATPPSGKAPKRVSVRSLPDDQQILVARAVEMVRNGEAPDILAATAILGGQSGQQQPASSDEQGEETGGNAESKPSGESVPTIQAIQTKLDDLRAQRDQAALDYDVAAMTSLGSQIEEALVELSEARVLARLDERDRESQAHSYQKQYQTVVEEIETAYPELQDDDSAFSRVFDGMVVAERNRNPQAFADPRQLRVLADEVAGMLNVRAPSTTQQPRTPLPAQPRPSTANGSAVAPGHTQANRLTSDEARRYLQTASLEELDALIDG